MTPAQAFDARNKRFVHAAKITSAGRMRKGKCAARIVNTQVLNVRPKLIPMVIAPGLIQRVEMTQASGRRAAELEEVADVGISTTLPALWTTPPSQPARKKSNVNCPIAPPKNNSPGGLTRRAPLARLRQPLQPGTTVLNRPVFSESKL
jgi:hypothetical protein